MTFQLSEYPSTDGQGQWLCKLRPYLVVPASRIFGFEYGLAPIVEFLLRLFLPDSVTLLQSPYEFVFAAGDHIQIIVGELAPVLLDRPFHLVPFPLYLIPVHNRLFPPCQ